MFLGEFLYYVMVSFVVNPNHHQSLVFILLMKSFQVR